MKTKPKIHWIFYLLVFAAIIIPTCFGIMIENGLITKPENPVEDTTKINALDNKNKTTTKYTIYRSGYFYCNCDSIKYNIDGSWDCFLKGKPFHIEYDGKMYLLDVKQNVQ